MPKRSNQKHPRYRILSPYSAADDNGKLRVACGRSSEGDRTLVSRCLRRRCRVGRDAEYAWHGRIRRRWQDGIQTLRFVRRLHQSHVRFLQRLRLRRKEEDWVEG